MDAKFSPVDGGIVKDVAPFFRAGRQLAVVGVWSGGSWSPSTKEVVRQYRGNTLVGVWQIRGVEYPARQQTDAVLLLEPQGEALSPRADDVLVFGDGVFSRLPVVDSTLALESDAAVEVGEMRYHGVAQVREKRIEAIWLFHRVDAVIDRHAMQPMWWRGQQFSIHLQLSRFVDATNYVVQLTLGSERVPVHRLLKTLSHCAPLSSTLGRKCCFKNSALRMVPGWRIPMNTLSRLSPPLLGASTY